MVAGHRCSTKTASPLCRSVDRLQHATQVVPMYCRDALLLLCTLVLLLPCWSLPTLLEEQLYTTCFYDYNHRRCDVSAEAVLRLTPASSQAERYVVAGSLARDVVHMQSCSSSFTRVVSPGTFATVLQHKYLHNFISAAIIMQRCGRCCDKQAQSLDVAVNCTRGLPPCRVSKMQSLLAG